MTHSASKSPAVLAVFVILASILVVGAGNVGTAEAQGGAVCMGKTATIDMNTNGGVGRGTPADDVIVGTAGPDRIDGLGGNDTICARGGQDTIDGGDGTDRISGGPGSDTIVGGDGIDRLWGGQGNDLIEGEGGSDRIWGGDGQDDLRGGSGADRMWGGAGADTMLGMGGQDQMWGDAGNDNMQGNHQTDHLWGGSGDDTLRGAKGKDRLWGDAGDDSLFGGVNTDFLVGGTGNDFANGQLGRDKPFVTDVSGCDAERTSNCAPGTSTTAPTNPAPPSPEPTNPAPSGPVPAGWDQAVATANMSTIRGWYMQNTGFEACHDSSLGRNLRESDLVHRGGGHITQDNTVIYGAYITGKLTIRANNVSIRCSVVDARATTYGIDASGYGFTAGRNWTIENVSFRNANYNPSVHNHDQLTLRPMFMNTPGTARFNQMLNGYSSGYDSYNASNQLWEYNFTDRVVRAPGSHNTGFGIRSLNNDALTNLTLRRNLTLDGTSAAFTFYANSTGLHSNLLFEENIFDLPYTTGAEFCAYTGLDGGGGYRRENIVWRDNIWGKSNSAVCGRSGPFVGKLGTPGSSGNRYLDGQPVG